MKRKEERKKFYVSCDCGDPYHTVELTYEVEEKAVYITTMTLDPSFWRRLKDAIAYLFGKKLIYSETITGIGELRKFCEFIVSLDKKSK